MSRAKAEVLANYDEILITLRKSFTELAEDSAQRLEATRHPPIDREEFVATVVAPRDGNDSDPRDDSGRADDFDEAESHRFGFGNARRTAKQAVN